MHVSRVKPSVPTSLTPWDGWRGGAPEQPRRGGPRPSGIVAWQVAAYLAIALAACAATVALDGTGVVVPVLPAGAIP